jgi:integral membrane sensor domain MASE1
MVKKKTTETFEIKGEELVKKFKELIHEGNVRRIIIKNKEGKTLIEFPLTFGVVGALIAPVLAAVGAIAALVAECSIVVEREE